MEQSDDLENPRRSRRQLIGVFGPPEGKSWESMTEADLAAWADAVFEAIDTAVGGMSEGEDDG